MILKELIQIIEKKYPLSLAYEWDNVGLMIGDINQDVHRVLTVLEIDEKVVQEAIENKVDLIISHHPFLFHKFNRIHTEDEKGKLIFQLIQNNISVYSMHTNFDIAFDGLNDYFMKVMGFTNYETFDYVDAPSGYSEANENKTPGLGRIVELPKEITLEELCELVKEKFHMNCVRYVGDKNAQIRKVAVITGGAADMFPKAKMAGADAFISGDMKYHNAQDAIVANMNVIDCGHYETEVIFRDAIGEFLEQVPDLTILKSELSINPFQII